jgi:hypothetical protein
MNSLKKTKKKDLTEPDPLQFKIVKLNVNEQQIETHWLSILRGIIQLPKEKK